MSVSRTRWAAVGAAIAVAIGGGGLFIANAGTLPPYSDDSVFHPIEPERVLDTRRTIFVSNGTLKLDVEGPIQTISAAGTIISQQVVPTTATAVAINLTVTEGLKRSGYGFVKVYPCVNIADPEPVASAINFENNVDIANSLVVKTSATGEICLSVFGTADLIVDISGYYDDSRLEEIESRLNTAEIESETIVMTYPVFGKIYSLGGFGTVTDVRAQQHVLIENGYGDFGFDIPASPAASGRTDWAYRLKSVQICIPAFGVANGGYIRDVEIFGGGSATQLEFFDNIPSSRWSTIAADCETWEIAPQNRSFSSVYRIAFDVYDPAGGDGDVQIQMIRASYEAYYSGVGGIATPGL